MHVTSWSRTTRGLATAALLLWSAFSAGQDWHYTFRSGDTLWDLCLTYTKQANCWQQLGPYNNISKDRQIPPGTVIRIPTSWLKNPPEPVIATYVSGDARFRLDDASEDEILLPGMKLDMGSTVTTGEGSANLRFADGSQLQLEPHSELRFDVLSSFRNTGMVDSSVRLGRGAVKTRVMQRQPAHRFRIVTPAAVAAVRGTDYRVSTVADGNRMQAEVLEGRIAVSAQGRRQLVDEGFGVVTRKGEAPETPKKLLTPPVFSSKERDFFLPARIAWQNLPGARSFQLDVMASGQQDQLIQRYSVEGLAVFIDSLPLGCYGLRLNAIDVEGLHGLPAYQDICLVERPKIVLKPPVPELKTKEDQDGAQMIWQQVEGADSYRVQISDQADFSSIQQDYITTQARIELLGDTTLYVRVQATGDGAVSSAYSKPLEWVPEVSYWGILVPIGVILLGIL